MPPKPRTEFPKLTLSKIYSISIPALPEDPIQSPSPRESETASTSLKQSIKRLTQYDALDFNELNSLERHLYLLQKGAPLDSEALPVAWSNVKQSLFDNGEIAFDELNDDDLTASIKDFYEDIRLKVAAFWNSKLEPLSNKDWTLRRMEHLDAFERPAGSKYWKHHADSLLPSTSVKANEKEIPETDFEGSQGSGPSQTRIQKPVFVSEDEVFEDAYEDEALHRTELDSVLVETMRDVVPSSEDVMSNREIDELLSLTEQFLAEDTPDSPINNTAHRPLTPRMDRWNPINQRRLQRTDSKLPEAFIPSEKALLTSVDDGYLSGEGQNHQNVKSSKEQSSRAKGEIIVHEDSPGKSPTLSGDKVIGGTTDVLTENLEEVSMNQHAYIPRGATNLFRNIISRIPSRRSSSSESTNLSSSPNVR